VEWRVRPAVVRLFQGREIEFHQFHDEISAQRGDECLEIALLVVNITDDMEEGKSKLTPLDVVILNDSKFQPQRWSAQSLLPFAPGQAGEGLYEIAHEPAPQG
jgi:hypothetical protein